jgi:hypothetical protein
MYISKIEVHLLVFSTFYKLRLSLRRTDGRTDGQTEGRMDRWMDDWMDGCKWSLHKAFVITQCDSQNTNNYLFTTAGVQDSNNYKFRPFPLAVIRLYIPRNIQPDDGRNTLLLLSCTTAVANK